MQVGFIRAFQLRRGVDNAHVVTPGVIRGRNVQNGFKCLFGVVGNDFFRIVIIDARTMIFEVGHSRYLVITVRRMKNTLCRYGDDVVNGKIFASWIGKSY